MNELKSNQEAEAEHNVVTADHILRPSTVQLHDINIMLTHDDDPETDKR